jgi:hypothetical protein
MSGFEHPLDRPGGDLRAGFPTTNLLECERACWPHAECRASTWVKPGIHSPSGMCWLKRTRIPKVNNESCVSGIKLRDPLSGTR